MKVPALISAIIPTRNRPDLVLRAVKSALNQSYTTIEVLVVIDGHDDETARVLNRLADPRVQVIHLADNVGGSEARNTGIRAAAGEWIAFLDDDDEWLPGKLAQQMLVVESLIDSNVILSSAYVERSSHTSRVYPSRFPDAGEPLDVYLCCPRGFSTGGEVLQTSTLVAPRAMLLAVPFVPRLKRGQDFMWLIRAGFLTKATFHVVPDVLSIFNAEGFTDERRISSKPNWRDFYACVRNNKQLFAPRAYSYCIATRILTDAIKCKEPFSVKFTLLVECFSTGYITPKCILIFLYIWMVPPGARCWLGYCLRFIIRRAKTPLSSQAGVA